MQTITDKKGKSRQLNIIKRAMIVQNIVAEHFEPGNQSKSKSQVYRQHIKKQYPMGERTFWRYMSIDVKQVKQEMTNAPAGKLDQLKLPFEL